MPEGLVGLQNDRAVGGDGEANDGRDDVIVFHSQ
jgi:hypothetical protein